MSHLRKQIRDNIVTTLTGLGTTGSNVYRNRVYPLADDRLPGIIIYTANETAQYLTMGYPRTVLKTLTVNVEAYVKSVANFDDTVDQINLEIDSAISADVTRGGLAKDTRLVGFSSDISMDGEQPVYVAKFDIEVIYIHKEDDPETAG